MSDIQSGVCCAMEEKSIDGTANADEVQETPATQGSDVNLMEAALPRIEEPVDVSQSEEKALTSEKGKTHCDCGYCYMLQKLDEPC